MKCRRENLDKKTSLFSRSQRYVDLWSSIWSSWSIREKRTREKSFTVRCTIDHNAYALYMYRLRMSHMSKFVDRLLILDQHFSVVVIWCCYKLSASVTITSVIYLFARVNALRRTCFIQLENDMLDSSRNELRKRPISEHYKFWQKCSKWYAPKNKCT